eukprot:908568_1
MSNIKHITAVVFTLLYPLYIHAQTIEVEWGTVCTESYGCANTTITDVDYVQAMGYKSIYGSSSSITISGECKCFGSHSCGNAYGIASHSSSIICSGSNACSRCSHVEASLGVSGRGANALTYSSINTLRSRLNCYGEHSCAYTQINSISEIHGRGAHSLLFAMIDSVNSIGTLHIYLKGFYSGYGATIRCRSHHNCTIHCTAYTCTSLDLLCDTNATCITKPSFNSSINDPFLVRYYNAFTVSQTNDMACTSSRTFDAFKEMYQYNGSLNNTGDGPLCCRGFLSCAYYETIKHTYGNNASIVCSGFASCKECEIISNGPIFCEGRHSCSTNNIPAGYITTEYNVYCLGAYSCQSRSIHAGENLFCSGYFSCHGTNINSTAAQFNLYLLGESSGDYATITCDDAQSCSILCHGYNSCTDIEVTCNGQCNITVQCDHDTDCPFGWTPNPTMTTTTTTTIASITSNPTLRPMLATNITLDSPGNPNVAHVETQTLSTSTKLNIVLAAAFSCLAGIGFCYSKIAGARFHFKNVLWFGYHAIDYLTDVSFALWLYHNGNIILFGVSLCFVFLPSILSLFQLKSNVSVWFVSNCDMRKWFESYTTPLYMVCFVTGSCQTTIYLFTSNLFGLAIFGLELNSYQKLKLHNQHLLSNVLCEAIPQFTIQCISVIKNDQFSDVRILSMIFSVSSLIMAPFILMSTKQMIRVLEASKPSIQMEQNADDLDISYQLMTDKHRVSM